MCNVTRQHTTRYEKLIHGLEIDSSILGRIAILRRIDLSHNKEKRIIFVRSRALEQGESQKSRYQDLFKKKKKKETERGKKRKKEVWGTVEYERANFYDKNIDELET